MGTLPRSCAKVREPSKLRFGVVRGVGRCIAVLDESPRRTRGMGGFGFFVLYDFYCAAASLLLGQFLELRGAWASASRACLLYTSDAADE